MIPLAMFVLRAALWLGQLALVAAAFAVIVGGGMILGMAVTP